MNPRPQMGLALERPTGRASQVDLLLLLFITAYLLLHWLLSIPVWDRYWLPLLPLASLLIARAAAELWRRAAASSALANWPGDAASRSRRITTLLTGSLTLALLLLLWLPAAAGARRGQYPVGGRPGADDGAWQIAAALAAEPYGTVLYDHWYSWQWRYHLFDKQVHVNWFPDPAALAQDLAVFGRQSDARYIVLPPSAAADPVKRAVAEAGFELLPVLRAGQGMALFRLQPRDVAGS